MIVVIKNSGIELFRPSIMTFEFLSLVVVVVGWIEKVENVNMFVCILLTYLFKLSIFKSSSRGEKLNDYDVLSSYKSIFITVVVVIVVFFKLIITKIHLTK